MPTEPTPDGIASFEHFGMRSSLSRVELSPDSETSRISLWPPPDAQQGAGNQDAPPVIAAGQVADDFCMNIARGQGILSRSCAFSTPPP